MEPEVDANIELDILDKLNKKPAKGILKTSSSFEATEAAKCIRKSQGDKATKWDEMNIIATLHPPDKDYGHMKIDEPKTPFEREVPEDEMDSGVDPNVLIEKMSNINERGFHSRINIPEEDKTESEDEIEETEEERKARKAFEMKRKAHYNEFFAAKVARNLIELEDEDDEDDDDINNGSGEKCTESTTQHVTTDSDVVKDKSSDGIADFNARSGVTDT